MSVIWDGITARQGLQEDHAARRHALADAAKSYDWTRVLSLLDADPSLANTTRPDGQSWYAPLHQAAHGNAPNEVCPRFMHVPWACSQTQIPWRAEGIEGTKLFYLANQQAFWFCGHRALDDCYALLELLEMPLPVTHRITIGVLLDAARRPTAKVWALNAPFEVKDRLRERGYRWNVGDDGRPRAWHREVHPDQVEAEVVFLDSLGFPDQIEPLVTEVDALIRFSDRLF